MDRWFRGAVGAALFVVPVCLVVTALEVAPGWVVEHHTIRDGLPVNSVTDLAWSRDGYLWLTTFDGLVRFDGHRFTVHSTASDPALFSNRLTRIRRDRHGNLWLATEQGHLIRRTPDGTFADLTGDENFPGQLLQCFARDVSGAIWICGDRGIAKLGDGSIERVPHATGRDVRALLVDRQNRIWTAYADQGIELWENDSSAGRFPLADVQVLRQTSDGSVYAGAGDGLWRLTSSGAEKVALQSTIHEIDEDDGFLWFLSDEGLHRWDGERAERIVADGWESKSDGLLLLDRHGGRWMHSARSLHLDGQPILSSSPPIRDVIDHREGGIWVATAGGLLHLRRSLFTTVGVEEGLSEASAYPIVSDHDGTLLAGTLRAGWNRVDPDSLEVEIHASPRTVRSLVRDRAGALWIGGEELCRMTARGCVADPSMPFRMRLVQALHVDSDGAMWIGTYDALFRRDADGRWVRLEDVDRASPRNVRVIADGTRGDLWLGTAGNGLYHWDGARFRRFTAAEGLPSDQIRALRVEPDGSVWVGTEDRGIAHVHLSGGGLRVATVGTSEGLFDDNVHQILDDGMGRLWMSSNRGLFWVLRADLEALVRGERDRIRSISYNERHGLVDREANGGIQSAGTVDRNGRLWFPTQGGLVRVDPRKIPFTREPPPVRLEGVRVEGERRSNLRSLRLEPQVRDFRVEYTALAFTSPERVRFRYRLEGFDDEWVDGEDLRGATYTNVPPGEYHFRVAASYDGREWSESSHPLEIVIVPWFHETTWFRGAGVLAIFACIPLVAWGRTRRLERKKRALEQLVDERTHQLELEKANTEEALARVEEQAEALTELDRLKSGFFANVSHELRTPLTMIIGPLDDLLQEGEVEEETREQLVTMRRNALRLLRLVNQILDLHRLEAGGLELRRSVRDLAPFVRRVSESFVAFAERNGIDISIDIPHRPVPVSFDPEQMEKVLANLLSNAVKFTPREGRIGVSLLPRDGQVTLSVGNSGSGIDASDIERIFDRYYRGSAMTTLQEGSGIGLALVRELVDLHGGRVSVESEENLTTFTIRLQLSEEIELVTGEEDGRPTAPPSAARVTDAPGSKNGGTTLLVVEDNVDVQRYTRSVLEGEYSIAVAADGREGLEKAREIIPDLIISDVMMPVMDGFELARELRNDPMTEPIPLILLTARATPADEVEGLGTGADDYLAKPFSSAVLRARVEAILGRRAALRERLLQELLSDEQSEASTASFDVRLRALFEKHLGDDGFSLEALAEELGMSRSTLERRVQESFDRTPHELLLGWRLDRSAALLRSGDASVTEVAFATGFRSLAHFSRAFQGKFGVAPSAWRSETG